MPENPEENRVNCIVVLGPTASGKTTLGVSLAHEFGGEIISADSRQVYRGLDIGSGKDLDEYEVDGASIPYHLIDIVDLDTEYNVFAYQRDAYAALESIWKSGVMPIIVGGTGLYLEAVLQGYRMVEAPNNPEFRAELSSLDMAALRDRLAAAATAHNTTDTKDRERLIRAIEIAEYTRDHEPPPAPEILPLVLGTKWERPELHRRIEERLRERLHHGLIEEVGNLLTAGADPERLNALGLEYRFVTAYLRGEIRNENDLMQKLLPAIRNFAKRQETWFRRMEKRGTEIQWIERANHAQANALVQSLSSSTA